MGQSDLDALLDMGFERERAELACKQNGGRNYPTLFLANVLPRHILSGR